MSSETRTALVWGIVVGLAAFALLLALTACDTDQLPEPQPEPGLVCTTYPADPPVVECQSFPAPYELPVQP